MHAITAHKITALLKETFEDTSTLVCVGLRRIVTVAFLRRVQIFLLTYLLNGTVRAVPLPTDVVVVVMTTGDVIELVLGVVVGADAESFLVAYGVSVVQSDALRPVEPPGAILGVGHRPSHGPVNRVL